MKAHDGAAAETYSEGILAHSRAEEPNYRAMKAHFRTRGSSWQQDVHSGDRKIVLEA
jgi:hypothetical protein